MVIPQATQPPPAAPVETRGRDEIVLEGGEKILGRVLKQTGTYIEIRLDQNTVVGFNRSRVTRITRGRASAPPSARARLSPRDGWYLLHAGDGRTLGYLHGLVQRTQDGGLQLTEEWFFGGEKETTRITLVEAVSPDLIPLSSFYHERVLDRSGRMLTEEIRRGIVEGAQLRVDWRSLRGRERRTYPMPEGVRFPMSMREEIRQSHDISIHAANQQVFDVTTGQFKILRASSVQRREVEIGQRVALVREVLIEDGGRQNREWMDRNCQV